MAIPLKPPGAGDGAMICLPVLVTDRVERAGVGVVPGDGQPPRVPVPSGSGEHQPVGTAGADGYRELLRSGCRPGLADGVRHRLDLHGEGVGPGCCGVPSRMFPQTPPSCRPGGRLPLTTLRTYGQSGP